jgi:hypothetical protein
MAKTRATTNPTAAKEWRDHAHFQTFDSSPLACSFGNRVIAIDPKPVAHGIRRKAGSSLWLVTNNYSTSDKSVVARWFWEAQAPHAEDPHCTVCDDPCMSFSCSAEDADRAHEAYRTTSIGKVIKRCETRLVVECGHSDMDGLWFDGKTVVLARDNSAMLLCY